MAKRRRTRYQSCLSKAMKGKRGKRGPILRAAHKQCKKYKKKK